MECFPQARHRLAGAMRLLVALRQIPGKDFPTRLLPTENIEEPGKTLEVTTDQKVERSTLSGCII